MAAENERLQKQIAFIKEIDKVKSIFRQTYLADGTRKLAYCIDGSAFERICIRRCGCGESYDNGADP